jgi:hypothetical protein
MVSPIDYTMDVLSPIEGYMGGLKFGEGIQTGRLNRELLQSQEGREQEKFAIAKQDREAARANAARQMAQAQASQAALAELAEKGLTATHEDFVKAWVANPAIRTDLGQLQTMLKQPQIAALINANQNLYAATSKNNPEVVARLLEEQITVAQSPGGDPSIVRGLQLSLDALKENPDYIAQIRVTTGLTLLGLTSAEYMKQVDERLGVGGGDNAKVQSTVTVGNGRISVQTMTNGTTRVVDTATNTALTGVAAAQAIEAAEVASAEARGNIKKQEGTGTLEAKIELGGEAAAEEAAAKIAQDLSVKAFTSINSIYQNIANLNDVKRLIGEGANTGRIVELLPDWNQATIELRNVQGKLGLDVVGSVTFGALNKSELDLALSIGLPTGLDEGALNKWVDRKIAAQQKLAGYLSKQAKFLSDPKNNLNDWLKKIEKESSTSAAEVQPAPADAASGSIPLSFMSDEGVKKAAAAAGVTPEEMWEVMPDDMRAKYGR